MDVEFKSFGKIQPIGKLFMSITQKLHGTNAQILIREGRSEAQWALNAGSRTRWLTPENDNYGFARWAYDNKQELIEKLGEGRHFGEWCGPGINNGEGLQEKTFCLFNWQRWIGKELPKHVAHVPPLYTGPVTISAIEDVMDQLKAQGSRLVCGYMHPEGIVIQVGEELYKKVFEPEETQWGNVKKDRPIREPSQHWDVSRLIQPLRLEKLLSRDEAYTRDYPESLVQIAQAYMVDLITEDQLTDEEIASKDFDKAFRREVFLFVKSIMGNRA